MRQRMLLYRVYIALLTGLGFVILLFLVFASLRLNQGVAFVGIAMLMPGISMVGVLFRRCCESPLPMLAANGLIYSGAAFPLVWLATRGLQEESLHRFARYFTLVVVATVAVAWGTARALESLWSAPSDEALAKQFNQHRNDLEILASMAQKDSQVSRIAGDFIWRQDSAAWPRPEPEWGITADRWNEYRKLFRKIGLTAGLNRDTQGNVYFIVYTEGSVVSGASKGFVYCERTGVSGSAFLPCAEQRDFGKYENPKGKGSEYRRLAQHWYTYSDWD